MPKDGSPEESPPPETTAPEETVPISTRLRYLFRTYRLAVSVAVLAVGGFLSLLGLAAWSPLLGEAPFNSFVPALKGADYPGGSGPDWTLVMIIVGPLLAIIGIYLVIAYVNARRRFEHLMRSKSKAEFLRNLPEVEELLWDLTPEDDRRLFQKKQELRIRT